MKNYRHVRMFIAIFLLGGLVATVLGTAQPAFADGSGSIYLPMVNSGTGQPSTPLSDNPASFGDPFAGVKLEPPKIATLPAVRTAAVGTGETAYECFPTCSEVGGRMLAVGGTPLVSLSGQSVSVKFVAPSTATSFELGIFDGDTGRDAQGAISGNGHWDLGTSELVYTLYAEGSTETQVAQWHGNTSNPLSGPNWTADAVSMPDNAWWNVTVTTSATAQTSSGSPYIYRLEARMPNFSATSTGDFKVRTSVDASISAGEVFGVEGSLRSFPNDFYTLYPQWNGVTIPAQGSNFWSTTPTPYDGTWQFLFDVPAGQTQLVLWDGDFDFGTDPAGLSGYPSGAAITPCAGTPDADTPPGIPSWAVGTAAVSQTVAAGRGGVFGVGEPPDDVSSDVYRRTGCPTYTVTDSVGNVYANNNPSGNQYWSQFLVTTDSATPADYHVNATSLPAGTWTVNVNGLDLSNAVYFRFPFDVKGFPSGSIGDRVWRDTGHNGDQSGAGLNPNLNLNGWTVNLYQDRGSPTGTPDGKFCPGDLNPSGCGSGVGPDILIASQQTKDLGTAPDGNPMNYDFKGLGADTYWVSVVPPTSPTYYQTYDENDGTGNGNADLTLRTFDTPNATKVVLAAEQNYHTADFGYDAPGASDLGVIGDTVWDDTANQDGQQASFPDTSEPGINGVIVNLYVDQGKIGTFEPITDTLLMTQTTTTTNGLDGQYLFSNLPAGNYFVQIAPENFDTGGALTGYTQTPNAFPFGSDPQFVNRNRTTPAAVTLLGGGQELRADFGYVQPQLAAIGDTVWADLNNDGIWQPANEPGIPGVVVNLYNDVNGNGQYDQGTDTPYAADPTQTTDAGGQYLFDNIPDGKYIVQIAPANSNQGQPLYGFTQTIVPGGGDVDGHNHPTPLGVTITNGVPYFNADFGYVIHFTLRKQIFRYWDSPQYTVSYDVPDNTSFQVKVYKLDNSVQPPAYADYLFDQNGQPQASGLVLSVSQANPVAVNLGPGDYKFCEINVPAGYLPAYKYGTADQGCFTWSAGQYPDYSMANVITFDLSVKKSGVTSAKPGATITYNYVVQNAGPASVKPTIADNLCKNVVLKSGDANNDGLIQPDETWTYSCDYPVPQAQQCGSTIVNTVIVGDAADPKPPSDHWVLKGETNLANNTDSWSVAVDCGTQVCLQGTDPKTASQTGAVINTTVNANGTITIRVTLSRGFADTAYGPNSTATGWPGTGRKYKQIWTSDELEMKLKDANGNVATDFQIDLLSPDSHALSGYSSSGIASGSGNRDGALLKGNASDIVSWDTSIARNLNTSGWRDFNNSPAVDANYHYINGSDHTPGFDPSKWDWDTWYEVTVKPSAFGSAGYGSVEVPSLHSSPSKTGVDQPSLKVVPCAPPPPPPASCSDVMGSLSATNIVVAQDGKTASASITNNSQVQVDVGIASYREFDNVIDNQQIFDSTTAQIPPGKTVQLTVKLAFNQDGSASATQIDLFCGSVLQSLNGNRYGTRLLKSSHLHDGSGGTTDVNLGNAAAAGGAMREPNRHNRRQ